MEFTASIELCDKLTRAQELCSHSLASGHLGELFERALDALIERETKRREGAGAVVSTGARSRKRRRLKQGSRHIPVEVARAVRARDGSQCAFVDAKGRRCCERRFLTFDHAEPYVVGGAATVENLRLLCSAHNAFVADEVFGCEYMERKRAERAAERDVQA